MSGERPLDLSEMLELAALVVAALVGLGSFVIAYVVHEEFRAWVRRPLLWPRRRLRLVLTDLVLLLMACIMWVRPHLRLAALVVATGLLLCLFHREVRAGIRWLWGLPKRIYLWLLWELVVRPAGEHLGLVSYGGLRADEIERLRSLSSDAQWVLWLVLRQEGSQSGERVRLRRGDVTPLLENGTYGGFVSRARSALAELEDAGFVENASEYVSNGWEGFSLQIAEGLRGRRAEGARRWLVLQGVAAAVGDLESGRRPTGG
jgi:hypothetical protein